MVNEMRTEMMAMRVELSAKCQSVSVYAVHFHEFECGVNTAGNWSAERGWETGWWIVCVAETNCIYSSFYTWAVAWKWVYVLYSYNHRLQAPVDFNQQNRIYLHHECHGGHEILRYDTYGYSGDTIKIWGRFQLVFFWYMSKITKYSSKSPKMKTSDHGLLGPCPLCIFLSDNYFPRSRDLIQGI